MTSGPASSTDERFRRLAAGNNADWCDVVAHANGVPTGRSASLWWAEEATPAGYPDVVTLVPDLAAHDLPAVLEDDGRAWTVKDSFADLDLGEAGFQVVFDAEWIARPSSTAGRTPLLTWHTLGSAAELAAWAVAHGSAAALNANLLAVPDLYLLGAYSGDELVAGAVANVSRGTGSSVLGLSNVFAVTTTLEVVWQDLVTLTSQSLPGLPLVGWESSDDLLPALAARFDVVGPLRIWRRTAAGAGGQANSTANGLL